MERGIAETKMYQALTSGEIEKAKTQYAKVRDFRSERKALLQLEFGNQEEAIKLAASAVKSAAEQARPLATQAYIFHRTKKPSEAKTAMNHLRRIAPELDLKVQWFARLNPLAKAMNLPSDWRQKQPAAKDMGLRPKLDDLGPFRWHPSPAPDWTLTDRNGESFSLKSQHGKPMVLIFYLG